jgi:hypothetical protein
MQPTAVGPGGLPTVFVYDGYPGGAAAGSGCSAALDVERYLVATHYAKR